MYDVIIFLQGNNNMTRTLLAKDMCKLTFENAYSNVKHEQTIYSDISRNTEDRK